jgi:4-hydroxybenzoate polyprenyltransferase
MVIDVITLATLYTLRVIAGAVALNLDLSFWLLAFSMFIFLSLALVKRYAELFEARALGRLDKARGRGYFPDDLQMVAALGAAAGYMAVMVLALYINDSNTTRLYQHPEIIWLACPLLLTWVSRVWMLAHRGQMNEDPVIFAVQDRTSLAIGALVAVVFWAAT